MLSLLFFSFLFDYVFWMTSYVSKTKPPVRVIPRLMASFNFIILGNLFTARPNLAVVALWPLYISCLSFLLHVATSQSVVTTYVADAYFGRTWFSVRPRGPRSLRYVPFAR